VKGLDYSRGKTVVKLAVLHVLIPSQGTTPVRTTFHLCHTKVAAGTIYEVFRLLQRVPINSFPRNVVKDPGHTERMLALTAFAQKRLRLHNLNGKAAAREEDFSLLDTLQTLRNHSASDPHDKASIISHLIKQAEVLISSGLCSTRVRNRHVSRGTHRDRLWKEPC
jgi:hypothetical protein